MRLSLLPASLLLTLLLGSAMSQESTEDVTSLLDQVTDPDFQRLSASFWTVAPSSPKAIPFSRKMETFLDSFSTDFAFDFGPSDAKKIEAYRDSWWQRDYLSLINEANASAFQLLNPFYKMGYDELATGGVHDYVATIEQIEADMETKIAEHHSSQLLQELSDSGRARVMALLDEPIATRLADAGLPEFDLRGFSTAYPGVMAKQLLREASQIKGPPAELEIREVRQGDVVMVGTFPKDKE